MIRMHDSLSSGNGYKVRLLLAQLGLTFERIEYDLEKGETRTPGFLEKVNSNGRISVLETESGESLPESNAILFYLADGTPPSELTYTSAVRLLNQGLSRLQTLPARLTGAGHARQSGRQGGILLAA